MKPLEERLFGSVGASKRKGWRSCFGGGSTEMHKIYD